MWPSEGIHVHDNRQEITHHNVMDGKGYSVFVGNFMILDRVMFRFWLLGYTGTILTLTPVDQSIANCLHFVKEKNIQATEISIRNYVISQVIIA
jgi:hypothetical protein